jgi:hypothetical protein
MVPLAQLWGQCVWSLVINIMTNSVTTWHLPWACSIISSSCISLLYTLKTWSHSCAQQCPPLENYIVNTWHFLLIVCSIQSFSCLLDCKHMTLAIFIGKFNIWSSYCILYYKKWHLASICLIISSLLNTKT